MGTRNVKSWQLVLLLLFIPFSLYSARPGYYVIKKIRIGGEGGWDYLTVDSQARRLYVSRSTHVIVIDLETDKLAADIPDTQGVHGIAVAPDLNRGFTSNGKTNNVTIFDLKTLKILGKVKTGVNPDAIVYDPATKRVFAFNGRSNDVTAINGAKGKVVGTISLGGKPEFARANGKGKVYANIEDKNEVVEIDAHKLVVTKRMSLSPGNEPSGMGLDAEHDLIFSGCHNKMMTVLDVNLGVVTSAVPIGEGVDGNDFDPETGLAFSANGEGTLTVAQETAPGKFDVIETVPTQRGARTMAIDPKTHNIYLPTAEFGPTPETKPGEPRKRPPIIKDTFVILVIGK